MLVKGNLSSRDQRRSVGICRFPLFETAYVPIGKTRHYVICDIISRTSPGRRSPEFGYSTKSHRQGQAFLHPAALKLGSWSVAMMSVLWVFWEHCSWDYPTKKGGHKASSYRQIEQYPDPSSRSYCSGRIRRTVYSRSFYQ